MDELGKGLGGNVEGFSARDKPWQRSNKASTRRQF